MYDGCADGRADASVSADEGVRGSERVAKGEGGRERKKRRVVADVAELVETREPRDYECDEGGWSTEPS